MPVLANKNPLELLKAFRDKLGVRTGLTNFDRNSKIKALIDSNTDEFLNLREEMVISQRGQDLMFANGKDLDTHGVRLGLPRRKATFSQSNISEQNFAFYVVSGTFGDINSGADITVPAGEFVFSDANSNELGVVIRYSLTSTLVLPLGSSMGYFSARAEIIGSGSNVGRKVIRNHSFTGYTDSLNRSLKIINFYPILNGANDEPDDVYRFRLLNLYIGIIQANETKMKLLSLEVPGVLNARVEPAYFGIGTAGVHVLGAENQANSSLVQSVQAKINNWQMPGGVVVATPAIEVAMDFYIRVKPHKTLTTNEVSKLRSEVNKAFVSYYKTIGLGSPIDFVSLLTYVQNNIQKFASINLKNKDQTLRKIFVRKSYSGGIPDERERVVGNIYSLKAEEYATVGTLDIEIV